MKQLKFLLIIIFIGLILASCNKDDETFTPTGSKRYYDEMFNVEVTSNIKFGEAIQPTLLNPIISKSYIWMYINL